MTFSNKLKEARRSANLSQKQLAEKLNLSEKTISAYEMERAIPPVPTLEKIAKITGQPINFFMNGDEGKVTLNDIAEKLDIIMSELKKLNGK